MRLDTLPWAVACLVLDRAFAVSLDTNDADSIQSAAETIAAEMMSYYTGYRPGDNPGNLPEPYYWWEAGGMFGEMVDYWYCRYSSSFAGIARECRLTRMRAYRLWRHTI